MIKNKKDVVKLAEKLFIKHHKELANGKTLSHLILQ